MIDKNGNQIYSIPINDDDESCDRTCVELRIYLPNTMNPENVTAILGIASSDSETIGEKKYSKTTNTFRICKLNAWFLSSEIYVKSKDLRTHLDWLISKLQCCSINLKKLQEIDAVQMSVYCIWWAKYGGGGPTIWPKQMHDLAALDLECSFDFQYYAYEDNCNFDTEIM